MTNFARTSSIVLVPKLRFDAGLLRQYSHRIGSAPISSAALLNSIEFPALLCISLPCSSRTSPCPNSVLNGGAPSLIIVLSANSA